MRRGQGVAVIDFAIGGGLAVEGRAVPGGDAGFVIIRLFARIIPDIVDLIGLADLVDPGVGGTVTALFAGGARRPGRGATGQAQAQGQNGKTRNTGINSNQPWDCPDAKGCLPGVQRPEPGLHPDRDGIGICDTAPSATPPSEPFDLTALSACAAKPVAGHATDITDR